MLFNSYIFVLAFLPIVVAGYFLLNRFEKYRAAKVFLIIASLFFYGYYNWWYLLIIVFSVALNYTFSRFMLSPKNAGKAGRKFIFALALSVNIGSLFFFKYFDFFVSNVNAVFGSSWTLLNIALPLGISFFTFQQLSYVIDSYRGDENVRSYDFFDYALFVTYFPQLIAGPIVTHDEMVPQFADITKKRLCKSNLVKGVYTFTIGMAKKVLIADSLGKVVDVGFLKVNIPHLNSVTALIVMLAYTLQIYFDFSGYCDMATGIGKMMNIDITMNFNSPYKALGIVDFWKRWHITLTRFFTKYIYIPLGGNRKGKARTYLNVMIVFLVSGIWHGANWTFIVWGLLHGIASVVDRILTKDKSPKQMPIFIKCVRWLLTFAFLNLTWVIFRAEHLSKALLFYRRLFSFEGGLTELSMLSDISLPFFKIILFFISIPYLECILPALLMLFALIASVFMKNTNEKIKDLKGGALRAVECGLLMSLSVLSFAGVSSFLYWNF